MSLTSDALYQSKRYAEAKQNGYCAKCYNEKAVTGNLLCAGCREKKRKYNNSPIGKAAKKRHRLTLKGKLNIIKHNALAKPGRNDYMRNWRLEKAGKNG